MKYSNLILVTFIFFFSFSAINAQEETTEKDEKMVKMDSIPYKPFNFNLTVKNMHLWRGYRVTDAPMTGALAHYTSKNGKFDAGFWGGAGFNGDYTEIDFYVSYSTGGLSISLWDINNYSSFPDAKIFDYDVATTSHFVDLTVAYAFDKVPFSISWSTILLGRDTYAEDNGELKNAFSNYVELNYTVYSGKNSSVGIFASGAFSFLNDSNFYGENTLNNFGVVFNKDVKIYKEISLPASAKVVFNLDQRYAAIQVALNFF